DVRSTPSGRSLPKSGSKGKCTAPWSASRAGKGSGRGLGARCSAAAPSFSATNRCRLLTRSRLPWCWRQFTPASPPCFSPYTTSIWRSPTAAALSDCEAAASRLILRRTLSNAARPRPCMRADLKEAIGRREIGIGVLLVALALLPFSDFAVSTRDPWAHVFKFLAGFLSPDL